jgi:ceramide glucosyltransferase
VNTGTLLALAELFAMLAGLGLAAALLGTFEAIGFVRQTVPRAVLRPPITILKPLCGDEPLLEEALTTFCHLDYPEFQIVLGVQDPNDPALETVDRVRRRWPQMDITVVIEPALHGQNRKVSNLINMLPAARHDLLVFSDSDLHVPPDYLLRLGDVLAQPGVGLVTTLSVGRLARRTVASALGRMQISHCFLPSVLISRRVGRQDCLGTTMALHRRTLGLAGGLSALLNHLADDHVLGRRVRALGLSVELAPVITGTTVSEAAFPALWAHELRWARTIGALEPLLFAGTALQYPLFWAALAVLLSDAETPFIWLFLLAWAIRSAGLLGVARAVRFTPGAGGLGAALAGACLLPVRDALSVAVVAVSLCGDQVLWRGHVMRADDGTAWSMSRGPVAADLFVPQTASSSAMVALTKEGPS